MPNKASYGTHGRGGYPPTPQVYFVGSKSQISHAYSIFMENFDTLSENFDPISNGTPTIHIMSQ